ncbi:N-6 DNA methylase [Aerococcus vaginalis]
MIALIAEGAAEQAILTALLDHHALKFDYEDLIEEKVLRTRSAKSFAKHHLNKSFGEKVTIYRVLDSRKENFNLSPAYSVKVEATYNVRTRPEIEILHIIYHDDYETWSNDKKSIKPSDYAKQHYNDLKNIKSFDENFDFWNKNFNELISVLKKYKSIRKKGDKDELTLADLLK